MKNKENKIFEESKEKNELNNLENRKLIQRINKFIVLKYSMCKMQCISESSRFSLNSRVQALFL